VETADCKIIIKAISAIVFGILSSTANAHMADCDIDSGSNLFIGNNIAHSINTITISIDITRLPRVCDYNHAGPGLTSARKPERMQA